MKTHKQLDCQLKCKATIQLDEEVRKDLGKKDKSLAQIIAVKTEEITDEGHTTKDISDSCNRKV
jgi:hypothetical protein